MIYADLAIIDLSKAKTPEGRAELVPQLREALATTGFFYAINHGYSQAQVFMSISDIDSVLNKWQTDRIFDLANYTFDGVSEEEKKAYTGNTEVLAKYQGYKPRKTWVRDSGYNDNRWLY